MRMNELLQPFDIIQRPLRFAVELIDPITLEIVHKGVTVTVTDTSTLPIVNLSGRFVWFADPEVLPDEQDVLPDMIIVNPGLLPYEPETISNPKPIDSGAAAKAQDKRLIRVILRPTTNYPFSDGVTSLRGCLKEGDPLKPIEGAEVWFRWQDMSRLNGGWKDSPIRSLSGRSGDFAVTLQPSGKTNLSPLDDGRLPVHLAVKRGFETRQTKQIIPNVHDGRVTELPEPLTWDTLVPF